VDGSTDRSSLSLAVQASRLTLEDHVSACEWSVARLIIDYGKSSWDRTKSIDVGVGNGHDLAEFETDIDRII
jgi:hypothetical protein